MQLIQQEQIDKAKWDSLVMVSPDAAMHNQSVFLDALAENWCLLINEDYSVGLPIPFTIRMGVKGIYTPNFLREFSFIGVDKLTQEEITVALNLLQKEFAFCTLDLVNNYFNGKVTSKVFQFLQDDFLLNSQAKRSIKKFEKSSLKIEECKKEDVISIISDELTSKVRSLKSVDMIRFEELLENLNDQHLVVFGAKNETHFLGGQIFIHWKNKLQYIKGGCNEEAKNNGAMFMMMTLVIEYARKNNLLLDFGGSNVAGVQRFNHSFGAKDKTYYEWNWDNSPKWFSLLKSLKNQFKKK